MTGKMDWADLVEYIWVRIQVFWPPTAALYVLGVMTLFTWTHFAGTSITNFWLFMPGLPILAGLASALLAALLLECSGDFANPSSRPVLMMLLMSVFWPIFVWNLAGTSITQQYPELTETFVQNRFSVMWVVPILLVAIGTINHVIHGPRRVVQ